MLTGEIGKFGDIPIFTDCCSRPAAFAVTSPQQLANLMDERKDDPHTCGSNPCSRHKWWQSA